jgi:hypothetical protein
MDVATVGPRRGIPLEIGSPGSYQEIVNLKAIRCGACNFARTVNDMTMYIMEVYDRPEGTGKTALLIKCRINAENDFDAIAQARILFPSHDTPSVTGFMLRLPGIRLADDYIVHEYNKKSGAYELAKPKPLETTTILTTTQIALGEEVTAVPPFVGFDR